MVGYAPVNQTLDDRHLSLLELLFGVTASGVGDVDSMAHLDVIGERNILHLTLQSDKIATLVSISPITPDNVGLNSLLGVPFAEKFDFLSKL